MEGRFRFTIRQLLESVFWLSVGVCSSVGVYRMIQRWPVGVPQHGDGRSIGLVVLMCALWLSAGAAFGAAAGTLLKKPLACAVLGIFLSFAALFWLR